MKKFALLLLIINLLGFATNPAALASTKQTLNHKEKSLLFVVYAKTGHLRKLKNGYYQLTMDLTPKQEVIEFTDRPTRYAKTINLNQLGYIAEHGKKSFTKIFPNAALTSKHNKPIVFIIQKGTRKGNQALFTLLLLNKNQHVTLGKIKTVSLFIDSSSGCSGSTSCDKAFESCTASMSTCNDEFIKCMAHN